jgi:hypothetical protein
MLDELAQLLAFYERCDREAVGHGLLDLERDWNLLIERFVHGECDESECEKLARFLQTRPRLIAEIAERLQMPRPNSEGSPADTAG